jgi:hypothetical protein
MKYSYLETRSCRVNKSFIITLSKSVCHCQKNGLFHITSHELASLNHQTSILSVNDYFFNIGALVK